MSSSKLAAMRRHDIPSTRDPREAGSQGHTCEPGTYVACLIMNRRRDADTPLKVNRDIEHFLVINEDGTIDETGYVSHAAQCITTFTSPRRWGAKVLGDFQLVAIDHLHIPRRYRRMG